MKLGLTDFHESLSSRVFHSKKTSRTDQLKIIVSNAGIFLTVRSFPRNDSRHCMNRIQGLVSSLVFGSMRRDSSPSSRLCSRSNTFAIATSCIESSIYGQKRKRRERERMNVPGCEV